MLHNAHIWLWICQGASYKIVAALLHFRGGIEYVSLKSRYGTWKSTVCLVHVSSPLSGEGRDTLRVPTQTYLCTC